MRARWVNPQNGRWYRAESCKDLLGDWCLELSWGGKDRPPSGHRVVIGARANMLRDIAKTRRRHGYLRVIK